MAEDMKFKYYYQDERGRIRASEENVPTDSDLIADFSETGEGGGGSSDISISVNNTTYTPSEEGVITLPDYPEAGMTNPMTTAGDIIVGGTDGAATRLASTTTKSVLTSNNGIVGWEASSSASLPTSMTLAEFLGIDNFEIKDFENYRFSLSISEIDVVSLYHTFKTKYFNYGSPSGTRITLGIGVMPRTEGDQSYNFVQPILIEIVEYGGELITGGLEISDISLNEAFTTIVGTIGVAEYFIEDDSTRVPEKSAMFYLTQAELSDIRSLITITES